MKTEKNILLAFILNVSFAIFEFIGGAFINSIAIMSDSFHDMGDAVSIGISYFLEKKSLKKPDDKYTFGYTRFSVIGSLITTSILLIGSIIISYNAIKRLFNPIPVNYKGMMLFALLGVIINFWAAYFTKAGQSLNQRAVNLHMLEDVFGWLVVLIGSIIMHFTDIFRIDSILSIVVAVYIFINTLKNLKEILAIILEKVPNDISILEIRNRLLAIKGVNNIHNLHVWSIDGYQNYATIHVVTNRNVKERIREELSKFNISHVTIELEKTNEECRDKACVMAIKK